MVEPPEASVPSKFPLMRRLRESGQLLMMSKCLFAKTAVGRRKTIEESSEVRCLEGMAVKSDEVGVEMSRNALEGRLGGIPWGKRVDPRGFIHLGDTV